MSEIILDETNRLRQATRNKNTLARQDVGRVDNEFKTLEEVIKESEQKGKLSEDKVKAEAKAVSVPLEQIDEYEALKANENFNRLAKHIGLSTDEIDLNSDKIKFLIEWGKRKTNSNEIVDVLVTLKNIRKDMGFSEVGKTALNKFYQYARLEDDSIRIKKEMELLKEK